MVASQGSGDSEATLLDGRLAKSIALDGIVELLTVIAVSVLIVLTVVVSGQLLLETATRENLPGWREPFLAAANLYVLLAIVQAAYPTLTRSVERFRKPRSQLVEAVVALAALVAVVAPIPRAYGVSEGVAASMFFLLVMLPAPWLLAWRVSRWIESRRRLRRALIALGTFSETIREVPQRQTLDRWSTLSGTMDGIRHMQFPLLLRKTPTGLCGISGNGGQVSSSVRSTQEPAAHRTS